MDLVKILFKIHKRVAVQEQLQKSFQGPGMLYFPWMRPRLTLKPHLLK